MEEHSVFCKKIPKQAPREGLFKVEMNTWNKLGNKEALGKFVYWLCGCNNKRCRGFELKVSSKKLRFNEGIVLFIPPHYAWKAPAPQPH